MARVKEPKAKIVYVRLSEDLDKFVMEFMEKNQVSKSDAIRKILQKVKDMPPEII